MGSTTRIDRALKLAHQVMFTKENGGRGAVPKILILLTDGAQVGVQIHFVYKNVCSGEKFQYENEYEKHCKFFVKRCTSTTLL